jgi:hypothetical protein
VACSRRTPQMTTTRILRSIVLALPLGLVLGCGGDQKQAEEPDTSQEVKEAGEAVGEEVQEGAEDAKDGTKNAVEETREEVEDKDLDGDGDK